MELSRAHVHAAATAVRDDTAATLRGGCDGASCSSLCRRLDARLDAELDAARRDGVPLACAPGCTFCCHQRVGVLPHEAVALLEHLRSGCSPPQAAEIEARIRANARLVDGMTVAEHRAANLPCAFLVDGLCSAYEVRPSVCASFHSLSRERCRHAFENPQDAGTPRNSRPVSLDIKAFADAVIEATEASLADAGVPGGRGELHQRLRALLDDTPCDGQASRAIGVASAEP
jgi:Fe-S-cluster containining protein